ncbi:MAG: hypothetical protein HY791_28010 [Deltaproteobacteria bacterium]|nr:hypothetical protein [Deltaproteobacteria bacterium]
MSELVTAIETFADLTVRRFRGQLQSEHKAQLTELETLLRGNIQGARGGPKKAPAAKPDASHAAAAHPAAAHPAHPSAPQPVAAQHVAAEPVRARAGPPTPAMPAMSAKDAKKVRSVNAPAASGYTPPVSFLFSDYFGAELAPAARGAPSGARTADGTAVELSKEAQLFYGVQPPALVLTPIDEPAPIPLTPIDPVPVTPIPVVTPAPQMGIPPPMSGMPVGMPQPTPIPQLTPRAPQAVVHLMEGGHRRGDLVNIDLAGGVVSLLAAGKPDLVPMSSVLTVFVAPAPGTQSRQSVGQGLVVTLINGREVSGRSADYAPGVQAMTIVPDQRGKVDYIWVPAWAVKGIRLS